MRSVSRGRPCMWRDDSLATGKFRKCECHGTPQSVAVGAESMSRSQQSACAGRPSVIQVSGGEVGDQLGTSSGDEDIAVQRAADASNKLPSVGTARSFLERHELLTCSDTKVVSAHRYSASTGVKQSGLFLAFSAGLFQRNMDLEDITSLNGGHLANQDETTLCHVDDMDGQSRYKYITVPRILEVLGGLNRWAEHHCVHAEATVSVFTTDLGQFGKTIIIIKGPRVGRVSVADWVKHMCFTDDNCVVYTMLSGKMTAAVYEASPRDELVPAPAKRRESD